MTARSLYFVNWWADTLIIGGLSILVWIALLAFYNSADTQPIFWLSLVLSLVVNYPHFSATVYRLYQSAENIRQFPVTAWGLPLIMVGAVGASLWQPKVVPLPDWMDAAAQAVMWTGALVFAGFAAVWCLRQKRLIPPIVLLPALTHFTWFVPGAG